MDRNISDNQEENKANHFKKLTTEQLEKELKVYQAMDSGMLADGIIKELSKRKIINAVTTFYTNLKEHKNHRFMSWEHCFNAFQSAKHSADIDYLSLQLAFYLASWGMYRGSSGLLWKDYKIHAEIVNIVKRYADIHCGPDKEIVISQIARILDAKNEIKEYLEGVEYIKPTRVGQERCKISPTDTLITKILLGTLGCAPAYDRLLRIGFDEIKDAKIGKSFNEKSLKSIFKFISDNLPAFQEVQETINRNENYYPIMKIVDMYFWEVGRMKNPELVETDNED
jgi:hypothetical protein